MVLNFAVGCERVAQMLTGGQSCGVDHDPGVELARALGETGLRKELGEACPRIL